MNPLLIITLLLSGLCSLSFSAPRQFHVVEEKKTWIEAQQYCRQEFTDLATIDDMTEMEKVRSIIKAAGAGRVWIGLKQGSSSKWQWSLADRDFYRGNEAEFRNWGDKQPNRGLGQEGLVFLGDNGKWHDANADEIFHFVCYDGGNSTHPYVLVNKMKKWAKAQTYCREKHTDLASVRNQAENDQIDKVRGGRDVWIGLFRDAWEWSDGSSSSFRHWMYGEPDYPGVENCTRFYADKGWYNVRCTQLAPFICYRRMKRQIVRVGLKLDPQVNTSDPAVRKALLQQIQQKLREKGMPADTKMAWRKQPDGKIFNEEKKEGRKRVRRDEL